MKYVCYVVCCRFFKMISFAVICLFLVAGCGSSDSENTPTSEYPADSCEVHGDCKDGDQYTEDWCEAGACTFARVKFRVLEIASRYDFFNTIYI
ncbi:MAG: hypothetical protein PVI89_12330, partial [Desulfobacteraceae bacterium]